MFRYAILRMETEWKIVCARRRIGHFPTYESALFVARELASNALECGHEAEILTQNDAGRLFPVAMDRGWGFDSLPRGNHGHHAPVMQSL
jgi:hypothetical protein